MATPGATLLTASARPRRGSAAPAEPAPSRVERLRFLAFGRTVPAVLFGFLAWLVLRQQVVPALQSLGASASAWTWLTRLGPSLTYLVFCALPAGIYLTRPMPRARDARLVVRIGAFGGAVGQILAGVLVPSGRTLWAPASTGFRGLQTPDWLSAVAALGLLLCFTFAIAGMLFLRRNLSIIPEARRLVTGGPYRVVRNPLYLAEISAAVLRLVPQATVAALAVLAGFIVCQLLRLHWEEQLLRRTFPDEYRPFAARTARLIPGVW